MKRFASRLGRPWDLVILPLRGDAHIYLDASIRPKSGADEQTAEVRSVRIEREYELVIGGPPPR